MTFCRRPTTDQQHMAYTSSRHSAASGAAVTVISQCTGLDITLLTAGSSPALIVLLLVIVGLELPGRSAAARRAFCSGCPAADRACAVELLPSDAPPESDVNSTAGAAIMLTSVMMTLPRSSGLSQVILQRPPRVFRGFGLVAQLSPAETA